MELVMNSLIMVFLIWLSISLAPNLWALERPILITFDEANSDSLGLPWVGYNWTGNISPIPVTENINKYPSDGTIIDTFFIAAQRDQYFINLLHKSADDSIHVIKTLGIDWYNDSKSKYSTQDIDCIITLCIISKNGEEFVIVDQNNDNDLTNDPLLNFQSQHDKNKDVDVRVVFCNAKVDYYDGNKKHSIFLPISYRKIPFRNSFRHQYSIRKNNIGVLELNGQKYKTILVNNTYIEFNKYDDVWIDENNNDQIEETEIKSLHMPFTLFEKSYRLHELDRFGKYLIIEEYDEKANPPISIGSVAPDFKLKTLNDELFHLHAREDQVILIDFWGTWCGPCIAEMPHLKEAYKIYHTKGFEIVSIGIDELSGLKKFVTEKELDWVHIQADKNDPILELYQVTGYPTLYLLDKEKRIIAITEQLSGDNLLNTLSKFFD